MLDRVEKPLFGELPNRTLGSYITGTATILFTIGVITGLIIWFPKRLKNWKQGLKIKTGNWKRLNHDLHNSLAFYSIIILFLMGVTGPFWSFPWYKEALQKSLGTYKEQPSENRSGNAANRTVTGTVNQNPGANSGEIGNQSAALMTMDIERIVQLTDSVLDYEGSYRISFPQKPEDLISVNKYKTGFFAPAAADKIQMKADLTIDELQVFKEKPLNERISSSIKSIHIGDVYGSFSKILYFLACLVATSLPFTGTLIWINKMKKKKNPANSSKAVAA
jgi:uncharacterized iron-regulated membrane protein